MTNRGIIVAGKAFRPAGIIVRVHANNDVDHMRSAGSLLLFGQVGFVALLVKVPFVLGFVVQSLIR